MSELVVNDGLEGQWSSVVFQMKTKWITTLL